MMKHIKKEREYKILSRSSRRRRRRYGFEIFRMLKGNGTKPRRRVEQELVRVEEEEMRFAPLGIKPRRKMFYCSTAALFMFTHI
jgi:hypothetical protein